MTRARILADYVSSGDELALKAPLAGPTFTGTVAIPNVANLETAVVANTAKVSGSTNASDLASGTLAVARMAAGTIVQVTYTEYDAEKSDDHTSSTLTKVQKSGSYDWKGTIDNVAADNHVHISMSFSYKLGGGHNRRGGFGLFRDSTMIVRTSEEGFMIPNATGDTDTHNYNGQLNIDFIDESPTTGTNIYYLASRVGPATSCAISVNSNASPDDQQPFRCTLMEIQR
jgi:hypothetical protein